MLNTELNEIKNNFLLFDAQLDKFEYLIDIGKSCKGMKDEDKIEKNQIIGCASQSWVVCNKKNNQFFIDVDSEAHIVRGLLNILQVAIKGLSKEQIIDLNGLNILNEIGLGNSITSQRMNGFISALSTIKELVQKYE
tara:strand:- start:740 stop:1150 length:411 start_codon:yes stop_codon:yes gene_type:complete